MTAVFVRQRPKWSVEEAQGLPSEAGVLRTKEKWLLGYDDARIFLWKLENAVKKTGEWYDI